MGKVAVIAATFPVTPKPALRTTLGASKGDWFHFAVLRSNGLVCNGLCSVLGWCPDF